MSPTRITVLVNARSDTHEPLKTWLLASEALRRGHEVNACALQDLMSRGSAGVMATAQPLIAPDSYQPTIAVQRRTVTYTLGPGDIVLIRTNPGRDREHVSLHQAALHILQHAQACNTVVLNDPATLLAFTTKAYLLSLPRELCPQSLASANIDRLLEYARDIGCAFVVKPLVGSRGRGVFAFENSNDSNLRSVLETLTATGMVLMQAFVPEARNAEYRVVFVRGEPLRYGQDIVAVCRQASRGDFRNNVHAGASAKAAILPETFKVAVQGVSGFLKARGVFLAGVDMSGGKVLEINVHSPGGWDGAERSPGDFTRDIVTAIENQLPTT